MVGSYYSTNGTRKLFGLGWKDETVGEVIVEIGEDIEEVDMQIPD